MIKRINYESLFFLTLKVIFSVLSSYLGSFASLINFFQVQAPINRWIISNHKINIHILKRIIQTFVSLLFSSEEMEGSTKQLPKGPIFIKFFEIWQFVLFKDMIKQNPFLRKAETIKFDFSSLQKKPASKQSSAQDKEINHIGLTGQPNQSKILSDEGPSKNASNPALQGKKIVDLTASTQGIFPRVSNSSIFSLLGKSCYLCFKPLQDLNFNCSDCVNKKVREAKGPDQTNLALLKQQIDVNLKLSLQMSEIKQQTSRLKIQNGELQKKVNDMAFQLQHYQTKSVEPNDCFFNYNQKFLMDCNRQRWNQLFHVCTAIKNYGILVQKQLSERSDRFRKLLEFEQLQLIKAMKQQLKGLPSKMQEVLQVLQDQTKRQKQMLEQAQTKLKQLVQKEQKQFASNNLCLSSQSVHSILQPLWQDGQKAEHWLQSINDLKVKLANLLEQKRQGVEQLEQ